MEKPCLSLKCTAYNKGEDRCGALTNLKTLPPQRQDMGEDNNEVLEIRRREVEELLYKRPCEFSKRIIIPKAEHVIYQRGLNGMVLPEDIGQAVAFDLFMLDFKHVAPRYEVFRNYVRAMTKNAVHRNFTEKYGRYRCGTCAFFLKAGDGLPSRCTNPGLEPKPGQPFIQVKYTTHPREVEHANGIECKSHRPRQFISSDEDDRFDLIAVPDASGIEEALHFMESMDYMKSLGPRQEYLVKLIRLRNEGYTQDEIAKIVKQNRATVNRDINGHLDEAGGIINKIVYYQAGARDVFGAIYYGAIFELRKREPLLSLVVDHRDFSSENDLPRFSSIAKRLGISQREAVKRYIEGWMWIKGSKGGITMSMMDDEGGREPGEPLTVHRLTSAADMYHPDFYTLLNYAKGSLDRKSNGRIAAHILICEICSAELEDVEIELLPELSRPVNATRPLAWLAQRLARRSPGFSDSAARSKGTHDHVGTVRLLRLAHPLTAVAIIIAAVLVSVWWKAQREVRFGSMDRQITELTEAVGALKQQNESLQKENSDLRNQVEQSNASGKQTRQLLTAQQGAPEQKHMRSKGPRATLARQGEQSHVVALLKDYSGVVAISSDGAVNMEGDAVRAVKMSPPLTQAIRQLATNGHLLQSATVRDALKSISGEATRGTPSGKPDNRKPVPLNPMMTAIRSVEPILRWQPVSGASQYKVIIAYPEDRKNGRVVWERDTGTQTQVRPDPGVLERGQVYLWQVEASVGKQSILSPAVGFWVLGDNELREIEAAEQDYKKSAFLLASIFSAYGLYDEALTQVEQLAGMNPNSAFLQVMLHNLRRQLGK